MVSSPAGWVDLFAKNRPISHRRLALIGEEISSSGSAGLPTRRQSCICVSVLSIEGSSLGSLCGEAHDNL